ncbi:hypothetical protein [Paenibacillus radicis (ex Gao et al. 2016)]|uniref:Uncharacterized protein n=1 Tax=Paenibacillus radicis (ex Gao et al. 2016) TaxID=1737354 RepID=A0A917H947_9BACL|nr:hypothetical protein [Paenibacillus radicis (ex Gao et al. 2016)]GGG71585.1 hypothetical protein GCM10010918_28940 [Paenibacillus radicis (ex Gao et al. 2016)]
MSIRWIVLITLAAAFIFVLEWRRIPDRPTKAAFTFLILAVWAMSIAVSIHSDLPGPDTLIKTVLEPFIPNVPHQ